MTLFFASKLAIISALLTATTATFSHVMLEQAAALGNTSYRATLNVTHGCAGAPTTAVQVLIPAGFRGAKPLPKAGWTLSTTRTALAKPYNLHGRQVTEDVSEITWRANSRDSWLADAHFDEFVLRGRLPGAAGPMWFKVLQTCETGRNDWVEVPASGTSTQGLKSPAALLEIMASEQVGHQH